MVLPVVTDGGWTVGIFSSRERPETLWSVVEAARTACGGRSAVIDVLINGNARLADAIAVIAADRWERAHHLVQLRVWSFTVADKSLVWNTYLYEMLNNTRLAFFIDGYAEVRPDALRLIAEALNRDELALAATGVPTMGPSARRLQKTLDSEGGIHGNLYALTEPCVRRLRECNFRLPRGLYRTDSALGAAICFNLDPRNNSWNAKRIAVVREATWDYEPPDPWRWQHWKSLAKRRMRQAQGAAENAAMRRLFSIERKPVGSLPESAARLIDDWRGAAPGDAMRLFAASPLTWLACRRLAKTSRRCESDKTIRPNLVFQAT